MGQVSNTNLAMSGSTEEVDACRTVGRALNELQARERTIPWKVPAELCPVQTYPFHIVRFLPNRFVDSS